MDGTFALNGGSGSGAEVTIVTTAGEVTSLTFTNVGSGYVVGEVLTIAGGDENATITPTYVGVGDFSLWNGCMKSKAYWI